MKAALILVGCAVAFGAALLSLAMILWPKWGWWPVSARKYAFLVADHGDLTQSLGYVHKHADELRAELKQEKLINGELRASRTIALSDVIKAEKDRDALADRVYYAEQDALQANEKCAEARSHAAAVGVELYDVQRHRGVIHDRASKAEAALMIARTDACKDRAKAENLEKALAAAEGCANAANQRGDDLEAALETAEANADKWDRLWQSANGRVAVAEREAFGAEMARAAMADRIVIAERGQYDAEKRRDAMAKRERAETARADVAEELLACLEANMDALEMAVNSAIRAVMPVRCVPDMN